MRLLLGAGLSPAQADLLGTARAVSGDRTGKTEVLYLETPYLEFGFKSQSLSGTFSKWDTAGQCVICS